MDQTRPPLCGAGQPGLAHREYDVAVRELSPGFWDQWAEIEKARNGEPGSVAGASVAELRTALIERNRTSLAALKRGAHFLDAKRPIDWEAGFDQVIPKLMGCRNLAHLAHLPAEEASATGDPHSALNYLLDGMQFGADLVQSSSVIGEMIGVAILEALTRDALIDRGLYLKLPAEELERLLVSLSRLEARIQRRGLAFEAEMALFALTVPQAEDPDLLFNPDFARGSLRHGFSSTLRAASLLEREARLQEELEGIQTWPWDVVQARIKGIPAREGKFGPTLSGMQRESTEACLRFATMHLNLTSAAIRTHLGHSATPHVDPFGDALLLSATSEELEIRSVGPGSAIDADFYRVTLRKVPD